MMSPTNYHIPTHIAEGLAKYHLGAAELVDAIPDVSLLPTLDVLGEVTNPGKKICFEVGRVAGRDLLLIDDHDRPQDTVGVSR